MFLIIICYLWIWRVRRTINWYAWVLLLGFGVVIDVSHNDIRSAFWADRGLSPAEWLHARADPFQEEEAAHIYRRYWPGRSSSWSGRYRLFGWTVPSAISDWQRHIRHAVAHLCSYPNTPEPAQSGEPLFCQVEIPINKKINHVLLFLKV